MEEALLKTILERLDRIEQYSLLAAKNVLNIEDVSILTGLSKSHLYKLTHRQEIPHYKPNGKILYFDREDIERWMKQNIVSSNSEIEEMSATHLMKKRLGIRQR